MPQNIAPKQVLDAVRASPGNRVKVAVSDIDGVLRGKYLPRLFLPASWIRALGVAVILFGVARNLTVYPFSLLAPGGIGLK